jgi:hypothetical protein
MNLLSLLIAPLQAVVLFFAPHASAFNKPAVVRTAARSQTSVSIEKQVENIVSIKPIHRVRVVRNVDTSLPADRAGRMVVSGRFSDVCAELERLAASEMRAAY